MSFDTRVPEGDCHAWVEKGAYGHRCHRKAIDGKAFCWQHMPVETEVTEREREAIEWLFGAKAFA